MQPYQEASEEIKRQKDEPKKGLINAGATALSLAGSTAVLSKITPFLSKYISPDLAKKGLSKISPELGKFVEGAEKQGNTTESIFDYIKNKINPESKSEDNKSQTDNIIQKISPELHDEIVQMVGQGKKAFEVSQDIKKSGKYNKELKDIFDQTKSAFSDLISSIYGADNVGGVREQPVQQPTQQTPQQQAQPQQGQASQALMQALQAAQQARQRRQK